MLTVVADRRQGPRQGRARGIPGRDARRDDGAPTTSLIALIQQIRSAESLLALSHTLKLAFLLDASQSAGDAARESLRTELNADADRARAVAAMQALLGQGV